MTLRFLYGRDDIVVPFVAMMIPHVGGRGFGKCVSVGVLDNDDELIAGFVYHRLYVDDDGESTIEISAAALPGRPWVTRETLRIMYDYPFRQCRAQLVVHTVLASDLRMLRQFAALGCTLTRLKRIYGRNTDVVVCELTDEDWRGNKIFQRIARQMPAARQEAA